MKVYIAGKITGFDGFMERFRDAKEYMEAEGYKIMNPAILPGGFEHEEYMHICYAMIDICDGVYFLDNWVGSKGARLEHSYAIERGKWIRYQ